MKVYLNVRINITKTGRTFTVWPRSNRFLPGIEFHTGMADNLSDAVALLRNSMPDEFPIIRTSAEMHSHSRAAFVMEGDWIDVGSLRFEVLQTPGHSKGGLCFLERNEKILLSGDTLFAGAIGRTDHPGGDYDLLMRNIFEKLLLLDGQTRILPGHGPSSDISTERMTNPFLLPFNEPYEG